MCSIDDYYMAHLREAACWLGYRFLISTLVRLGWTVNHKKCVSPTQSLVFLGVGITTMYLGVPSLERESGAAVRQLTVFQSGP